MYSQARQQNAAKGSLLRIQTSSVRTQKGLFLQSEQKTSGWVAEKHKYACVASKMDLCVHWICTNLFLKNFRLKNNTCTYSVKHVTVHVLFKNICSPSCISSQGKGVYMFLRYPESLLRVPKSFLFLSLGLHILPRVPSKNLPPFLGVYIYRILSAFNAHFSSCIHFEVS